MTDDTSHTSDPPNSNYPNFLSDDEATFQEDEGVQSFDVEYRYEGQSGHTVTYSIVNNPNPDEMHIDPTTGEICWEDASGDGPKNEDVTYWPGETPEDQPYEFTVRVTDNGTDYDLDFKLYVANADLWWIHAPGPTDYLITLTFTEDSTASVPTSIDVDNTDEGHRDDATESVYTLLNNTGGTTLPVGLEGIRIDQYTGVISWDPTNLPDNDDIAHYLANTAEYQNLQIVFDDGHGGVLIDYVDIVLENFLAIVGDAPNWQEDYDEQGGSAYSFDIDTDDDSLYPDQADKYELVSGPSWLQIDSETGLVTSVAGFVPDNSHVGQHSFTVSATDGNGTVTRTFTFTIENRDPVFLETVLTVTEDSNPVPINYDTDDDTQLNDGRSLLYRIEDPTGLTDWLSMDPLTGYITLDPTNEHVGTYEFDIYVQDRNADYSSGANDGETIQHVTLIVENDPVLFEDVDYTDPANPTIHGSATEDSLFTQDLNSNDESDGDTFSSMVSDPDAEFVDRFWVWNGWVRLDPETGLISANPTNEHVTWDPITSTHTPHEILITVDDGNGSTHTVTYSLTVDNVDPVWQNPPPTTATWTITEDIPDQVYNLLADDEEQHNTSMGTTVAYMADPDPAAPEWPSWLTLVDAEEGILEAHVNNSHVGTHTVWLI